MNRRPTLAFLLCALAPACGEGVGDATFGGGEINSADPATSLPNGGGGDAGTDGPGGNNGTDNGGGNVAVPNGGGNQPAGNNGTNDPGGDNEGGSNVADNNGGNGNGVDVTQLTDPEQVVEDAPVACGGASDAGGFTFERIAKWRDDATAAYSMIHDDMCGPALSGIHLLAVPALEARGLTAGLGPFVQACESAGLWDVVQDAQDKGNEILNHSYTHPEISTANAAMEVTQAKADFDANLNSPVEFYIFPFDFFTPETIQAVGDAGHIGARAGNRDDNDGFESPPINSAEPVADLEVEFDAWPRAYSKYASWQPEDILNLHVWNAIEAGGWAVREFHSISTDANPPEDGSQGFGPVPLPIYEGHLDFLVDGYRGNQVWTAPPSTVIRYRHARGACGASVAGDQITFDTSNADCTRFATPISVIVRTGNDVASLEASQGGVAVYTRKLEANVFSVTADPTGGAVTLAGCSDAGPAVENVTLPAKPQPAASVCDIETVVGTGSDGKMDDLERDSLQIFPNPAQADGRTGSWSWYPQNVSVETIEADGDRELVYSGNVDAWSGVTLAFLGGNGAGACYDASAYTGVRFNMKGSLNSGSELMGKVRLSLITAETQTRVFGGDASAAGGHFWSDLDVTADWTTFQIPWGNFNTPTWGDGGQANLTNLPLGELQALDWGVEPGSNFQLHFDDIELY